MKEFSRGDLVTTKNEHSESFEKEYIYLGFRNVTNGTSYHIVGSTGENPSTTYFQDEYIKLIAKAKHIPVPKFKKGETAYLKNGKEVMILAERNEQLQYMVYTYKTEMIYWAEESHLTKESEMKKIMEAKETQENITEGEKR